MAELPPLDLSRPLRGLDLRHAALLVLQRWGPMSIREMLAAMTERGFEVAGPAPNKVLSEALRVEVRRERVRRVGWGRFEIGRVATRVGPPPTASPAPWDELTTMLRARPWAAEDCRDG